VTTIGADSDRLLGPLEMAQNLAASVNRHARKTEGPEAHAAAELAGNLALVSIAEDLHRVVGIMTGTVPLGGLDDEP
jgi:hypothetical protein